MGFYYFDDEIRRSCTRFFDELQSYDPYSKLCTRDGYVAFAIEDAAHPLDILVDIIHLKAYQSVKQIPLWVSASWDHTGVLDSYHAATGILYEEQFYNLSFEDGSSEGASIEVATDFPCGSKEFYDRFPCCEPDDEIEELDFSKQVKKESNFVDLHEREVKREERERRREELNKKKAPIQRKILIADFKARGWSPDEIKNFFEINKDKMPLFGFEDALIFNGKNTVPISKEEQAIMQMFV